MATQKFSSVGSGNKYQDDAVQGVWEPFPGGSADVGADSPRSVQWHSELNLLPVFILSVVIAGRSGVAIRTPSYLISGLRCLGHNLKEN